MKLHGTMCINAEGQLEVGGCRINELARNFGTPLYIMDEALIRKNCREYYRAFSSDGKSDGVLYAAKAFMATAICKIVESEGLGLDVVSGGELYIALKAGFPPGKLFLHGNNKSLSELEFALKSGVGRIVIDNFYELELLNHLAGAGGYLPQVLLRVAPGIEAHSHAYIRTGQLDSKFGFTLANGDALRAVETALRAVNLDLKGLHCHIGSQIFELDAFRDAARVMVDFLQEARTKTGWTATELDLGGGLGIYYSAGDTPPAIREYASAIHESVAESCKKWNFPRPKLFVEPGRSIVGPAGCTVYTIGAMKDIPGVRKYVAVDGGMTDNPRPALYQARYEGLIANKAKEPVQEVVSITGRCCESGDMLIWDLSAPRVEAGDLLVISCTGAYNYSMSSNYNCLPRPAVVLVCDGNADLIVARETYEDLVKNHLVPERISFSSCNVQS
ncbi:MAG: diaminopimelate decarboxylase [Bacillota bacterium]|nr:diaminopimelate decarboxylase [Bacillota bacterium]